MKVYLDEYGGHGYGADVIVVDLDDGTHVSAWCIVDNAEQERAGLEKHLHMVIGEATAAASRRIEALERKLHDYGRHFRDCKIEFSAHMGTKISPCTCGLEP